MPGLVHDIRVFIASPSGLEIEREAFRETLQEFNELDLQGRRVIFTPYGWELTLGGFGRPQELINKDLADCHYFILVLWDRWGSPPDAEGKFTSGCEEEFDLAVRCLKDAKRPMRQMVVFFKESADGRPVDAEQIEKVRAFRSKLDQGKEHLYNSFTDLATFQKQLRRLLFRWARDYDLRPAGPLEIPKGGAASAESQFYLEVLNPRGASSRAAVSINCRLQVVGTYSVANSAAHAILAQPGRFVDLGTLGGVESHGCAINEEGQVAGSSTVPGNSHQRAFLWDGATGMMDLGTLGEDSEAFGLNNRREVVGSYFRTPEEFGDRPVLRPFLWSNGVMIDIGTLSGPSGTAQAINDKCEVVGVSDTAQGDQHAFLWKEGRMSDLGTLGGYGSAAVAINNNGQIVGVSDTAAGERHAFLWQGGHMTDLGTLGGLSSQAQGINDAGQVCGFSITANGQFHAFLWESDLMQDLGTADGDESEAYGINARGHVVGNISGLPDRFTFHPVIWSREPILERFGGPELMPRYTR
jgi:probable HAF family extracellular repeat protein